MLCCRAHRPGLCKGGAKVNPELMSGSLKLAHLLSVLLLQVFLFKFFFCLFFLFSFETKRQRPAQWSVYALYLKPCTTGKSNLEKKYKNTSFTQLAGSMKSLTRAALGVCSFAVIGRVQMGTNEKPFYSPPSAQFNQDLCGAAANWKTSHPISDSRALWVLLLQWWNEQKQFSCQKRWNNVLKRLIQIIETIVRTHRHTINTNKTSG